MSAPILDSRQTDAASAQEILARLEQYVATRRPGSASPGAAAFAPPTAAPAPVAPPSPIPVTVAALRLDPESLDVLPAKLRRSRFDPATVDLFPYDLVATIVGCALTVLAYISFGRPVALAATVALIAAGESARRRRWFPSLGVNLMIGTLIGLVFVFTA